MSRSIFVIHHYDASVCVFFTFPKNPNEYVLGGLQSGRAGRSHNPPTISAVLCQAVAMANAPTITRILRPNKKNTIISFSFRYLINLCFCFCKFSWFFCCLGVLMMTPILQLLIIKLRGLILIRFPLFLLPCYKDIKALVSICPSSFLNPSHFAF